MRNNNIIHSCIVGVEILLGFVTTCSNPNVEKLRMKSTRNSRAIHVDQQNLRQIHPRATAKAILVVGSCITNDSSIP